MPSDWLLLNYHGKMCSILLSLFSVASDDFFSSRGDIGLHYINIPPCHFIRNYLSCTFDCSLVPVAATTLLTSLYNTYLGRLQNDPHISLPHM